MPDRPSELGETVPAPRPKEAAAPPDRSTVRRGDQPSATIGAGAPAPARRRPPRYLIHDEVARGAMGAVHRATDTQLNRGVAVKVMHPDQDGARFVIESEITARLPHPGVPPVYSLGRLRDGRMFLAMKLIEGRTLADELKRAARPDLSRLLGVFERICETVGFAHSRGIVHRDLKPANVMVGNFGEAYVMDWGLAKGAGAGPEAAVAAGGAGASDMTVPGAVKGTPAYMAPEQARGEPVDARADVFALGGILAAILTGRAPFGGTTVLDTILQAAQAELDACFTRLDACGADPELVGLAKRCLAAAAADRPANGTAVAAALVAYRTDVERRLRRAEAERAAAEAKAAEELNTRREAEARAGAERAKALEQRKRRRVQVALLGAVLALVTGGAAFAVWQVRQEGERARVEGEKKAAEGRAVREAEFKAQQAHQGIDANLKLSADLRKGYRFKEAGAALGQALDLAKGGAPERLQAVGQARRDLTFVAKLDEIRYRKWIWNAKPGGKGEFNTRIAPPQYAAAFAEYGLDLAALDPPDAAARIAAGPLRTELVAAIDDWALYAPESDPALRDRLLEIARRADPGSWTDRLRDGTRWADPSALRALASDAAPARLSPAALTTLAVLLERNKRDPSELLTAARTEHPTSFELTFALAVWLNNDRDGRQIAPYEAARALRPDNLTVWNNLGSALLRQGSPAAAAAAVRRAIALDPAFALSHINLGNVLYGQGDFAGAAAAHRRALALDPNDPAAHTSLGTALLAARDFAGAGAAHRRALALAPNDPAARTGLGDVLAAQGDLNGAADEYQRVIRSDPKFVEAHLGLGHVLLKREDKGGAVARYRAAIEAAPGSARAHFCLAEALTGYDEWGEAAVEYRKATDLDPRFVEAYAALARRLASESGGQAGTVEALRKILALTPNDPRAHVDLGHALYHLADEVKGDEPRRKQFLAEAVSVFRRAIELGFKTQETKGHTVREYKNGRVSELENGAREVSVYNSLGVTLWRAGDLDGAATALRRAIEIDPKFPLAPFNLGGVLRDQKDLDGALAAFRKAADLDPKKETAHACIGRVLREKKDLDGAVAAFRKAVELKPEDDHCLLELGDALRQTKDLDGAAAAYRKAAEASTTEFVKSSAYIRLGSVLSQKGDRGGAVAALRKAVEVDSTSIDPLLRLGDALSDMGDRDGAVAAFRKATERDPKSAESHFKLGAALYDKDDFAGAVKALQTAVELGPKSANAHSWLGSALRDSGDLNGAVAALRKAVELDPKSAEERVRLGEALADQGDRAGAAAAYGKAVELAPKSAKAHLRLGEALWDQGDPDGAVAALRRATELDPKSADAHLALGQILRDKRDFAGAVKALQKAVELQPQNATVHDELGSVFHAKGDLDGALAAYRKAAELDPKSAVARVHVGSVLRAKNDFAGAEKAFRRAIELDPKFPQGHVFLGAMYFDQKKYAEALACGRTVVKLAPRYADAHALVGYALEGAGDLAGARAALAEAARLDKRWSEKLAQLPAVPVAPMPREKKK